MELGEYDITDEFAVNEVYVLRVPNLATLVPEHDIMSPTVIKKVKTVHAGSAAPVVVRARQRRDVFCFSGLSVAPVFGHDLLPPVSWGHGTPYKPRWYILRN